jgi:hypothetical protein
VRSGRLWSVSRACTSPSSADPSVVFISGWARRSSAPNRSPRFRPMAIPVPVLKPRVHDVRAMARAPASRQRLPQPTRDRRRCSPREARLSAGTDHAILGWLPSLPRCSKNFFRAMSRAPGTAIFSFCETLRGARQRTARPHFLPLLLAALTNSTTRADGCGGFLC